MKSTKNSYVFQRVEKKYVLTKDQYQLFLQQIEPYMLEDQYGQHTICNIYYDTDTYELIRNSIEKPSYKEKLRLRSYGIPSKGDTVFLEIKKKSEGIVYKRRIPSTLQEAKDYLEYGIRPNCDHQILREINYFMDFYKPSKKVFLSYDRVAFFSKEDRNIRITFDHNILSRSNDLDLGKGNYGTPLFDSSLYLMEIKTVSAFPLWLAQVLSELKIYPSSFSKYGNVYKRNVMKGRIQSCLPVY